MPMTVSEMPASLSHVDRVLKTSRNGSPEEKPRGSMSATRPSVRTSRRDRRRLAEAAMGTPEHGCRRPGPGSGGVRFCRYRPAEALTISHGSRRRDGWPRFGDGMLHHGLKGIGHAIGKTIIALVAHVE